jgi:hypothetical protein
MKKLSSLSMAAFVMALAACGGGGEGDSGAVTSPGTAGVKTLNSGDLDGTFTCIGGSYSLAFLITGRCTDNQIIQGTCSRTVTISGDKYFDYAGATSISLTLNTGVIQGPGTKAYYYGKTSFGDRLIYERYLPVLREGARIGVAIKTGSVYDTSGTEYSLDGSKNLLITSYEPKSLPANLTYSSESGGPGQISTTTNTCNRKT